MLAFDLFVNGTLMRGLKLHENLKQAPYLGVSRTESRYRIHSIGDVHPGMYRLGDDEPGGIGVPGELYRVSEALWPELEASEPQHLYRGRVLLEDGSEVWGILYPRAGRGTPFGHNGVRRLARVCSGARGIGDRG